MSLYRSGRTALHIVAAVTCVGCITGSRLLKILRLVDAHFSSVVYCGSFAEIPCAVYNCCQFSILLVFVVGTICSMGIGPWLRCYKTYQHWCSRRMGRGSQASACSKTTAPGSVALCHLKVYGSICMCTLICVAR